MTKACPNVLGLIFLIWCPNCNMSSRPLPRHQPLRICTSITESIIWPCNPTTPKPSRERWWKQAVFQQETTRFFLDQIGSDDTISAKLGCPDPCFLHFAGASPSAARWATSSRNPQSMRQGTNVIRWSWIPLDDIFRFFRFLLHTV